MSQTEIVEEPVIKAMIEGDVRYILYELFSFPGKIHGKINSTPFVLDSARSQFVFIHARSFASFLSLRKATR